MTAHPRELELKRLAGELREVRLREHIILNKIAAAAAGNDHAAANITGVPRSTILRRRYALANRNIENTQAPAPAPADTDLEEV